jgi:penicillin-binding protein 1B
MARVPSATSRRSRRQRRFRPPRGWLLHAILILSLAIGGYVLWVDHQVTRTFTGWHWQLPARVYARPLELYAGLEIEQGKVKEELRRLGYRSMGRIDGPGEYVDTNGELQIHTRGFRFWDKQESAQRFAAHFSGGRIVALESLPARAPLSIVRLEPTQIARIYPSHNEDRVLVRLADVPKQLVDALIATEDRRFYEHIGLDPYAIARAMVANLRSLQLQQGGSTLTQQLIKNYNLSSERTLSRKLHEMAMALSLERHYSKDQILEAYLNEIHLGQDGTRAIHGFGLAAEFYFGRPLNELHLHELALLVGLAKGASYYDPRRSPERARQRRDLVLRLMVEQGKLDVETAAIALKSPLTVSPKPLFKSSRYPAFLELVRRQLRQDYREEDLRNEGLQIFTTLDPILESTAETAVAEQIGALEKGYTKLRGHLQAATVVSNHQSGEILALIGDRNPQYAGFNRALDARRPVGSLLKPAVYLAALQQADRYTINAFIPDEPISVKIGRKIWTPSNYDGIAHGMVTLEDALTHSYNLATVQLGMSLGVPAVLDVVKALGIAQPLPAYPSAFLGAVDLSPMDIAQMYQTIAARGFRTPLRAIREVLTRDGERLQRYELKTKAVLDPKTVYLLTYLLTKVTSQGTGASLSRQLGDTLIVAGKTGTTNDLRDSWFAGFSDNLTAVTWIGRDDNAPIHLTGAQGAMRIWGQLMAHAGAVSLRMDAPAGVEWRWVDRTSGAITRANCPGSRPVPFTAPAPVAAALNCPSIPLGNTGGESALLH